MKIAIQFAMPAEFHALPGMKDLTPFKTISGIPFFEVAPDILAACGGVGKVNAAMCAQILCRDFHADLILNAGVAGCFTDLPIGTPVVVSDFIQHDVDTTAVGDPIGLVSTVNQVEFPTWQPEKIQKIFKAQGVDAELGRTATGDWFAVHGTRSEWIRDTFHPVLAEMEGGAIAQVCVRNGVRCVSLKTVSDHLFSEKQADEYFNFGEALSQIGRIVLPLAKKLQEESSL